MTKAGNDGPIFRELKVATWNVRGNAQEKEEYNLYNEIILFYLRVKLSYEFVTTNCIVSVNLCEHEYVQPKFIDFCITYLLLFCFERLMKAYSLYPGI
jgi:hypothetical protein